MTKVYNSAVVIIPPHHCLEPIQSIRKKYDRHIQRWMPHVNLFYPFRSKIEYDSLEERFSEFCSKIEPMEIKLLKFKSFNHGHEHYTVWLEPEPTNFLINLQLKLLSMVPDCNDVNKHKGGFTPHLSVGQVNGRDALQNLLRSLQSNWGGLKFILHEIFFISRENSIQSEFKIERTIAFKKKYEKS